MTTSFPPSATSEATPPVAPPSGAPHAGASGAGLRSLIQKAKAKLPKQHTQYLVRRSVPLNHCTTENLVRLVAHLREEVSAQANLESALALLLEQVAPKGFPVPDGKSQEDLALIRDELFTEKTA